MLTNYPKYVFVTGGVMSGLGKGTASASISKVLQSKGFKTVNIKIDPYLNVDAGTMNPIMHGEVFVTDDGGETDMDLGTYERFLDTNVSNDQNITTGQVYLDVIEAERRGEFLGKCVQIIPHVTDKIKEKIRRVAMEKESDVAIIEVGGTIGDIESLPFVEAARQMRLEDGLENVLFAHVSLVIEKEDEQKTKPTQHSVQELRRLGIQPDILICRSESQLSEEALKKLSLFSSLEHKKIFSSPDLPTIYELPIKFDDQKLGETILDQFQLEPRSSDLQEWRKYMEKVRSLEKPVRIGLVGKYTTLKDSYVSLNNALKHVAWNNDRIPDIEFIESEKFEKDGKVGELENYDGIIIPGGFGKRGSEGKIMAADYAREKNVPYLGLCFGFQLATISFARNVCELNRANSTELDPATPHPVIDFLPDQKGIGNLGATMRLGGHDINVEKGSKAFDLYGKPVIRGRHRHRYELNQNYLGQFRDKGLFYSGFSDNGRRAEILEIPWHVFYMATQYHPEFTSRPMKPEPIFDGFIKACIQ